MLKIKRLIILTFTLLSFASAWAQTDTEFWFAEPLYKCNDHNHTGEIWSTTFVNTSITDETFYFDSSSNLTSETITMPMPPNSLFQNGFGEFPDLLDTMLGYGYHITATQPINSTYNSRDHYTLKGANALGNSFFIPAPRHSSIVSLRTEIDIIATEDNTIVTINPSHPLLGPSAGAHSVVLQRGQTYYVRAASTNPLLQLGGSTITSSRPIAVNITADSVFCQGQLEAVNVIGEQLVPTYLFGSKHIIAGSPSDTIANQLAIYSLHDNTLVNINGIPHSYPLDAGTHITILLTDTINCIESDKPIALFHTIFSDGIIRGTLPPSIECSGFNQVVLPPTEFQTTNVQTIIVPTADTAHFTLDTNVNFAPTIFHPFPYDSTLSWGSYTYTYHDYPILSNPSKFHIIRWWQGPWAERSGLTVISDYAPLNHPHLYFNMEQHYCEGEEIHFHISQNNIDSLVLTGPQNLYVENPYYFYLANVSTNLTGWYHVHGVDTSGCLGPIDDSIFITVHSLDTVIVFDTINENQLPWTYHDYTIYSDTSFILTIPNVSTSCDSTISYHLYVRRTIYDTIDYYTCDGTLPLDLFGETFNEPGIFALDSLYGIHGEDSLVFLNLHTIPTSDTTIYDTIFDTQLPYYILDTVFTDSVADYIYHTYNEAGCDSTIHYNLYIWWNGDHCDTNLSFYNLVTPNGDGVNDRFIIDGLIENNCFKWNELSIFDRTGHRVYHKINISRDEDWWDPAQLRNPDGTYFFYFKAHGVNIKTQHTGVIEVLR